MLNATVTTRTMLPEYQRPAESFERLFGVAAAPVLSSMEEAGDDIPSLAPAFDIEIGAVGVRRRDVVVSVADPFGSPREVAAVCTVDLTAAVPRNRRGVHASRMGHIIAERTRESYRDLPAYAGALAAAVAESQYRTACVKVRGRIPYLERVQVDASRRPKLSLEYLDVLVRHRHADSGSVLDVGVTVTHLIACPCVQKTLQHTIRHARGRGRTTEDALPLMTHTQRCTTTVLVCDVNERRSPAEMLTALDTVLYRTFNTLPRDSELVCVYRAHRSPQFVEDAVRAAVVATARVWQPPRSFNRILGRSRSVESIHDHDLRASIVLHAARQQRSHAD